MLNWLISKKQIQTILENKIGFNGFYLYYNGDFVTKFDDPQIYIGIEGYILPREFCFEKYKHLQNNELILHLYIEYGLNFIKYIKGIFNILIVEEHGFYLFNDRHSIKKFFIYQNKEEFLISNNLSIISNIVALKVDTDNAALFCLMEHFIDGTTLFKFVTYSKPATKIKFVNSLKIDYYWLPDELLNLEIKNYSFMELAENWKTIVKQYIEYLKPKDITMTLTGGNDSRMILAALLNLGIKPNAFTFGNPESNDGVVAQKIAEKLNLNYNNHYVENPSANWFDKYANKIITLGNSLINIHRAHRLDAIEKEMQQNPSNEMIFIGHMGGEYVKGFAYADYITSKLFRLWNLEDDSLNKENIKRILLEKYFRYESIKLNDLNCRILEQKFINCKGKYNNFFTQFYISGSVHHTQDMNLYLSKVKYLISPFTDIDFLTLFFSSKFSMLYKKNNTSKNQLERLLQPNFHINITHILAPELSNIEYAKKGYYTANELIHNKVIFFLKRSFRYYFKKEYPSNFPYGEWFTEFSSRSIEHFSQPIKSFTKYDKIKYDIINSFHKDNEGYWHSFTNLINLDLIFKEYSK